MAANSPSILFINQTLGMGGAETFNAELLSTLQEEHGFEIHAFVSFERFRKLLQCKKIEAQKTNWIVDIVGNWKGLVKAVGTIPLALIEYYSIVKNGRTCDCVFLTSFSEKILVTPLAHYFNIPVVWVEFGPVEPLFQKFFGLPKFLYDSVTSKCQLVIVPTQFTREDIVAHTQHHTTKIIVIPCGVQPLQAKKTSTAVSTPTVVCVSRMEAGKGQELLVEAFFEVHQKIPAARLVLIGEGDHTSIVKSKISEHHLESVVRLLGFVPDVTQYLSEAALCVFPSVWALEGFGVVMIEAMSLAKPVVAFRRGPALEVINENITGLFAEAGSSTDLAQKIITLLEDPTKAQKMGAAGKKLFEEKFTISRIATEYATVLRSLRSRSN